VPRLNVNLCHLCAARVDKLIGMLGISGENIKQVQNSAGTCILINQQLPGQTKQLTLPGASADDVSACKALVRDAILYNATLSQHIITDRCI